MRESNKRGIYSPYSVKNNLQPNKKFQKDRFIQVKPAEGRRIIKRTNVLL